MTALARAPRTSEELVLNVEAAKAYIVACRNVDALKDLRDKAEAIKRYERARGVSVDAQNGAAEIVIRCDRKIGQLKLELPKARGVAEGGRPGPGRGKKACDSASQAFGRADAPERTRARAEDSRQQRLAKIPETAFEEHVSEVRKKGERLTLGGALSVAARQAERKERTAAIEHRNAGALPAAREYVVLYADPPWRYGDTRAGLADYAQSAAEHQYPTMAVGALCALNVGAMAARDSVLFCWATFPLLPDALLVVAAWGFEYKTAFVWDKLRTNLGNYHTASAELLLVATRGSCVPEAAKREPQIVSLARGKHSAKPEAFREMIDRLYPNGPRIELFRRGEAPAGWDVWGNEAAS